MVLEFCKMNGAGNDFVVIDNRDLRHHLSGQTIARLCNRQRGVGADGLLAVEPAQDTGDYRMRYYNADGGEAEMCGNGARCFGQFVRSLQGSGSEPISFETIAGLIQAVFHGEEVEIGLSDPFDLEMGIELDAAGKPQIVHAVNTGVPHAVVAVEDLDAVDMLALGRAIRWHQRFAPAGTNVNAMAIEAPGRIAIRTFERGVEDETLACGTGMVACAMVHHELALAQSRAGQSNQSAEGGVKGPILVRVRGGDTLKVEFDHLGPNRYCRVRLTGPADFVFRGTIEL